MRDVVARYRPDYVFIWRRLRPPLPRTPTFRRMSRAPSSCSRQSAAKQPVRTRCRGWIRRPVRAAAGQPATDPRNRPACAGRRLRAIQLAAGIDRALVLAHPWLARCLCPSPSITSGQTVRAVRRGSLARQVALAELAGPSTIEVGRMDSARDFTTYATLFWAYVLASVKGRSGAVYNVGTGRAYTIRSVAEWLAREATTG